MSPEDLQIEIIEDWDLPTLTPFTYIFSSKYDKYVAFEGHQLDYDRVIKPAIEAIRNEV